MYSYWMVILAIHTYYVHILILLWGYLEIYIYSIHIGSIFKRFLCSTEKTSTKNFRFASLLYMYTVLNLCTYSSFIYVWRSRFLDILILLFIPFSFQCITITELKIPGTSSCSISLLLCNKRFILFHIFRAD